MKNQNSTLSFEVSDQLRASKAVQQIQKWIEKKYPRLAASAKTRLIIECLIELTEERKLLAQG